MSIKSNTPFAEHLIQLYSDVIEQDIATRAEGLSTSDKEAIFQRIGLHLVQRSQSKSRASKRSSQLH